MTTATQLSDEASGRGRRSALIRGRQVVTIETHETASDLFERRGPATRTAARDAGHASDSFVHQAFFYEGDEHYQAKVGAFILEGLECEEVVYVVVPAQRRQMLWDALGADKSRVVFADMAEVGRNPARIIPFWQRVWERSGSNVRARGVGEPIWNGRSDDEVVECQWHEELINAAFSKAHGFRIMCPYDTTSLDYEVLLEARRSHPMTIEPPGHEPSSLYSSRDQYKRPFEEALSPPPPGTEVVEFRQDTLAGMRSLVKTHARRAGFDSPAATEIVLAVNEVATNTIRYAGGGGTCLIWVSASSFCCEVRDAGWIADPLAGRRRPSERDERGRGLWIANQVCDLVQIRSSSGGSAIRLVRNRQGGAGQGDLVKTS